MPTECILLNKSNFLDIPHLSNICQESVRINGITIEWQTRRISDGQMVQEYNVQSFKDAEC